MFIIVIITVYKTVRITVYKTVRTIKSLTEIKHIFVFTWFAINELIFKRFQKVKA